jgi:hypothetical protein
MRWRVLVVMTGLVLVTGTVSLVPPATAALAARSTAAVPASCGGGSHRWYTWAHSGSGTLQGTAAEARTWKHWNVAGHSGGFSDEAVWVINTHNANNALEVGFVTGQGATVFSNKMYMYYTTNNGVHEHDTFTELPKNKVIWMSAVSNGHQSSAFVYKKFLAKNIHYGVGSPRLTYEQAEVNFHNIPMAGGGSGSALALEFKTARGKWFDWGYIKGGRQKPYKIQFFQPNGVIEGGNGSHC